MSLVPCPTGSPVAPSRKTYKNDVLIVDDNFYNLTAIINMMSRFNLKADTAMDGDEAVQLIRDRIESEHTTYKLIMMDYAMPNCNGGEATKQIRLLLFSKAPTLEQPFICCLTSYAERSYQALALDAGMNGFLTKPVFQRGIRSLLIKANIIKTE